MEKEAENLVYFVRHGERKDVKLIEFGRNLNAKMELNTEITELGEKEAKMTGEFIKKQIDFCYNFNKNIDLEIQVISSPYIRCVQTALGVIKGLGLMSKIKLFIDYDLQEIQLPRYFAKNTLLKKEIEDFLLKNNIEIEIEYMKPTLVFEEKEIETIQDGYRRVKLYFEKLKNKFYKEDKFFVKVFLTHAFFQKGVLINSKELKFIYNLIDYCSLNLLTMNREKEIRSLLANYTGHLFLN